eukprot:scaffold11043_cov111-Isochrysis_galbana.AAC.5
MSHEPQRVEAAVPPPAARPHAARRGTNSQLSSDPHTTPGWCACACRVYVAGGVGRLLSLRARWPGKEGAPRGSPNPTPHLRAPRPRPSGQWGECGAWRRQASKCSRLLRARLAPPSS